ncbi:hypothetical protein B0A49_02082 [Cryomyces minteri]|uniref:VWFA domain-containing protein n=1 Tax=Cryomyces minteri TaxID=331657 RepID=A0A4U0XD78_9PEZI|nr:hypothetical protein B0A49_02082 [Cryomyces minteri]
MADSDGEYVQGGSDDDADMHMNGVGTSDGTRSKGKGRAVGQSSRRQQRGAQARWEASAQNTWDIQEGADGTITGTLESMLEAQKRKRLLKDTTPLQRGIIRHLLLILDLSSAMTEKDLKPTRYLLTLRYSIQYIREFFDQNPISQLGVIGMRDGLAIRVSDISGNPNDHIAAVRALLTQEPKGVPSLQNALEMARAGLWHTPSHGTREVVIVLGALLTSDPDDIHKTIKSCVRDKIRVGIIGLAARLHICAEICRQTNSGDESSYGVAIDEQHFKELLLATTTPPVVRSTDKKIAPASLLMMGFPSRTVEESPNRVFSHALNTVNKIRTGSQKPPAADRLKLYGLYKQSMEGDVDGVWDPPTGDSEEDHKEREKWDAWKAQSGLPRTEAKRRYISTLIETMHKYASPAPDARELVSELEFVWDQIKSNVPSSSSSSPLQTLDAASGPGLHNPSSYPRLGGSEAAAFNRPPPLRMLSPVSQGEEEEREEEGEEGEVVEEEFVDAPDSQYGGQYADEDDEGDGEGNAANPHNGTPPRPPTLRKPHPPSPATRKFQRTVESALVRLTTEIAALREQLEARRYLSHQRRHSLLGWALYLSWKAIKHASIDACLLGLVLLWMRRKQDRRLEGAVRVLLGDAVAQVKMVGEAQIKSIVRMQMSLPKLTGKKGS